MKRRAVPITAEHDDRDLTWIADAGTSRAAFAEIRAMPGPFTGDFHALRRQRREEAQAWCAERGLNYGATVRAVRQQQHDREEAR